MDLDNKIWSTLEGGYKIPYDASIVLKQLKSSVDNKIIDSGFKDLWDNLHHQGDVGIASYLSVPEIVTICVDKKSFDWNFIGLCLVIEHCRLSEHNPKLPEQFQNEYFNALNRFEEYLLANFKLIKDPTALRLALALFATLSGQPDLGKSIENLDEDVIAEFLEQF